MLLVSVASTGASEYCASCHVGDHDQYNMWKGSKHGQQYLLYRNESKAPKCQTCHMDDGHGVTTAWGFLGLRGEEPDEEWEQYRQEVKRIPEWVGPLYAPDVQRDTMEEWSALREEMIDNCEKCHTESFARKELNQSDRILKFSDNLTSKGVTVLNKMDEMGVISREQKVITARELLAQRMSAYMGSFHKNPEYTWDEGILGLQASLMDLREEAMSNTPLERAKPFLMGLAGGILVLLGFTAYRRLK